MSFIVQAQGISKTFAAPAGGRLHALREVSLQARAGQLTALVGPDGAGKTTLMRLLAALLAPDAGRLAVLGHELGQGGARQPQAVQSRTSYMPQRFGLYEDLSVQENLDLYADLHGVPPAVRGARYARLLEMTGLARFTGRPAGKLSGGMKQKLGLACTLVRSPDLLLLDEPSVGVDPLSRRDLWAIVQQLVEAEGLSVIVSTAYMDEAARCAQVFVLHQGRVLAQGAPQSLREKAAGLTCTAWPPAGQPPRQLQARLIDARRLIADAVPAGGAVRYIRQPHASAADVAALLQGAATQPRPAGLEDAFMLLLRQHEDGAQAGEGAAAEAAAKPEVAQAAAEVAANVAAKERPAIAVRDLVRRFGGFTAVASTSFEMARGEIFGLLGPNGAGKTTTFRMLCGLLPATSGQLEVAGLNLRTARAQARGRIGYVSQKFALYGNLSARENLAFFGGAYGLRGRELSRRVSESLAEFGLDGSAPSGLLPGGYKQRLAMAAALIHRPQILFLDEPTSGIDPLARRAFWRAITALAQGGVTVIVTTHFMEEAEYCDRIAIQDAGRLLALGTPQQVRQLAGGAPDMDSAFIAIVEQARASASETEANSGKEKSRWRLFHQDTLLSRK